MTEDVNNDKNTAVVNNDSTAAVVNSEGNVSVDKIVSERTAALRARSGEYQSKMNTANEELDALKKSHRDLLDSIGGVDGAKRLSEINSALSKNDDDALLKSGDTDAWLKKKTQPIRESYESQLLEMNTKNEALANNNAALMRDIVQSEISNTVRKSTVIAKAHPTAMGDINAHVVNKFAKVDGRMVMLEADNMPKQGRSGDYTIDEYLEGLKETHPHYWPGSVSGGATGTGAASVSESNVTNMRATSANLEEYAKIRENQNSR